MYQVLQEGRLFSQGSDLAGMEWAKPCVSSTLSVGSVSSCSMISLAHLPFLPLRPLRSSVPTPACLCSEPTLHRNRRTRRSQREEENLCIVPVIAPSLPNHDWLLGRKRATPVVWPPIRGIPSTTGSANRPSGHWGRIDRRRTARLLATMSILLDTRGGAACWLLRRW